MPWSDSMKSEEHGACTLPNPWDPDSSRLHSPGGKLWAGGKEKGHSVPHSARGELLHYSLFLYLTSFFFFAAFMITCKYMISNKILNGTFSDAWKYSLKLKRMRTKPDKQQVILKKNTRNILAWLIQWQQNPSTQHYPI